MLSLQGVRQYHVSNASRAVEIYLCCGRSSRPKSMIPTHHRFPSDLSSPGLCCQCKKATSRHSTKLHDLRCIDFSLFSLMMPKPKAKRLPSTAHEVRECANTTMFTSLSKPDGPRPRVLPNSRKRKGQESSASISLSCQQSSQHRQLQRLCRC